MHKASSGLFNIYNIERKISKHLSIVFWWIMEAIGGSSMLLGSVFTLDPSHLVTALFKVCNTPCTPNYETNQ